MKREVFKKMYPDVQEEEVTPEEFHKSFRYSKPGDISDEDMHFWEGFAAAYDLIDNVFCRYKEPPFDEIWDEIEEEFDNYKKDA